MLWKRITMNDGQTLLNLHMVPLGSLRMISRFKLHELLGCLQIMNPDMGGSPSISSSTNPKKEYPQRHTQTVARINLDCGRLKPR